LLFSIPLVSTGHIDGVYLAVIALVAMASFEAIAPLPLAAQFMESNLQSARRLFEVVDAIPEVQDPPNTISPGEGFDLQVRNLNFQYPNSGLVLRGISFDLPSGKRLAIVGPSGSGKSTLVNLLMRFWEVEQGAILLSGRDIQCFDQEVVRSMISLVPQSVYLFSASLRENLLLANPGASDREIIQAAQQAGIHDFIEGLPQGYETWVGDQGVRLSAGERQRIAIARSLLRPAALLILDEATANLDTLSEKRILQALFESSVGRSILMITHRLVGMEAMDEILVLDGGRIVERGHHQALLEAGGLYSRIWAVQHGTQVLDL
jgi:ABC-type multidrug transport system fused ATPase/permease subunit